MKKLTTLIVVIVLAFFAVSCSGSNPKPSPGLNANAVNIDVYAINDMHGNVLDSDSNSGGISIAKTTSYLKKYCSYDKNPVVIASGDMWQGSSESNNTKGKLVTEWMNLVGFDAMTMGNHEFDWGIEPIIANRELANFPFLAINVYETETNERAEVFDASVLIEKEEVTIGIIGAIGDCYNSISSSRVEGYDFKVGDELTDLVKEESERLRANGADVIIYSLHDGSSKRNNNDSTNAPTYYKSDIDSFYDVSLSDGYVDVVFEAHTHQSYVYKDEFGVYHVQASSNNKALACVDMDYDKKTGEVTVNKVETTDLKSIFESADAETQALFDKYADEIGSVYEVLGYNSRYLNSEALEDLCADLYLEVGVEKWGKDYDIFLAGGFLRTRAPYDLPAGNVTYKALQSLFPFDNEIVLCSVSGRNLKMKFVNTTNKDYHCSYTSYGEQNKSNIDDSKTYYVVVDSYTSDYKYNNLTVVSRYGEENAYARDLLAKYFTD